jgi:uncharacterized protein
MRKSRFAIVGAVAAATLIATAAPAFAHVTVSAPGATPGGSDQMITFRVPTESDTASTIGLKVQFPTDTPIASVLVQPQAGWVNKETTVKLTTPIKTDDGDITDAVSEVDWSLASGAKGIAPGEFGEFVVLAGQLPDTANLTFKAVQSYSDGSTVSWIQTAAPGSSADDLEHPAPVLTLGAAGDQPAAETHSNNSQTGPVVISVIALVVAVLGAGAGVLALLRGRRRADASS